MATLHEKLAASLEKLQALQSGGRHVFRSKEFPRVDREGLLGQGFLREVIKGFLVKSECRGDETFLVGVSVTAQPSASERRLFIK
jgi:hypothetical protein